MPLILVSHEMLLELKRAYRENLVPSIATTDGIRATLEEVLATPGSLVRAQICMANFLDQPEYKTDALSLAIGLEYFHLASLILDDLPCMDNALVRRGITCIHRTHGEANTILVVLALINRSYALFWSVLSKLDITARNACSELIERCLGLEGIINGQSLDLAYSPEIGSPKSVSNIADGKTGTLFRLSILLPVLAKGVPDSELHHLSRLSKLFGRLYQLIDDFKDFYSLELKSDKTMRDKELSRPNMILLLGVTDANKYLNRLLVDSSKIVAILIQKSPSYLFYNDILEHFNQKKSFIDNSIISLKPNLAA